jgi:hypothetical protein
MYIVDQTQLTLNYFVKSFKIVLFQIGDVFCTKAGYARAVSAQLTEPTNRQTLTKAPLGQDEVEFFNTCKLVHLSCAP